MTEDAAAGDKTELIDVEWRQEGLHNSFMQTQ